MANKIFLYLSKAIIYYFILVFVGYILVFLFNAPFENIWLASFGGVIGFGIYDLLLYFWKKKKAKRTGN